MSLLVKHSINTQISTLKTCLSFNSSKIFSCKTSFSTDVKEMEDFYDDIKNVEPRIERRKPQIKPFVKNLFLGIFNTDLMAFPEILNKQEINDLNLRLEKIYNTYLIENYSEENIKNVVKNIGLYGAPATAFHGGLDSILTERCRFMETFGKSYDIGKNLKNNWDGIDFLKLCLDNYTQGNIIPKLVTGDSLINIVINEDLNTESDGPNSKCSIKFDVGNEFYLTGEKIWTNEYMDKNYYIAICTVNNDEIVPILISPKSQGITFKRPHLSFLNTPGILLKKAQTNEENEKYILDIYKIFSSGRLHTSALCLGLLREIIKDCLLLTKNKYIGNKSFSELPFIQNVLSKALEVYYAMESMIYFTCGLADGYENPDFTIEAILCKVYATRETFKIYNEIIEILGPLDLTSNLSHYFNKIKYLLIDEDSNNKLILLSMLLGVQHTGKVMAEDVKKYRNPLNFPMFALKAAIKAMRTEKKEDILDLKLGDYLHPTLQSSALILERCVSRMKNSMEIALNRNGIEIIEDHRNLERLFNITLETYVAITSLSRASRSYCIGLHLADNEMLMAQFMAILADKRTQMIAESVDDDYMLNGDYARKDFGTKIFKYETPYFEHCLERVFF